ncbi:hypothetical protein N7491_008110 [Penicillium cf. griseofulvum]|uniref:Uncharacterized protein n=1 Tax=Penicillium cf. griseofulvum TaxID=2972120 RepID=A0A9W9M7B3_9EURO|nr:hypothetical protein N7472_008861 [Penicillium cf. griseofulvum]KAJ5427668.1 hypothetical protein N7491_008110 [Penicillium cf. griseofulvum]KAJ5431867.1 hypothetical protein N7445_008365 [Penicillium cf. griseofulvum]
MSVKMERSTIWPPTDQQTRWEFNRYYEPAIRRLFDDRHYLQSYVESESMGSGLCYHLFQWVRVFQSGAQWVTKDIMIGLFRRPGDIAVEEWIGSKKPRQATKELLQEMRRYAHHYDCPQVFVFDSEGVLVVQFRAGCLGDILSEQCGYDRYWVPCMSPSFKTLRAFRQLAHHGWYRVSAVWSSLRFDLEGSVRTYEYWSGNPVWITGHLRSYDHPEGWVRKFFENEVEAHPVPFRIGRCAWVHPQRAQIWDSEDWLSAAPVAFTEQ